MKNNCEGLIGKQLLIRKNQRVLSKNRERSSFGIPLLITENPSTLSVDHRQVPVVAFAATNTNQKFQKKALSNIVAPSKENILPECELGKDWEYS